MLRSRNLIIGGLMAALLALSVAGPARADEPRYQDAQVATIGPGGTLCTLPVDTKTGALGWIGKSVYGWGGGRFTVQRETPGVPEEFTVYFGPVMNGFGGSGRPYFGRFRLCVENTRDYPILFDLNIEGR
jgi:hypothetical protein